MNSACIWSVRWRWPGVNETFLQHHGSTDVITFDHRESKAAEGLHGERLAVGNDAVSFRARRRVDEVGADAAGVHEGNDGRAGRP